MGNYNPYEPFILGQEWVPIRDENTVFSPAVNAVEYGHGFTVPTGTTYTLTEARGYINAMPTNVEEDSVLMAAVYPRGLEVAAGPIRRVVIPVDSAQATGVSASSGRPYASILLTPEQGDTISFNNSVADSVIWLSFNTQAYAQALVGKRILAVNVLYGMQKFLGDSSVDPYVSLTTVPLGLQGGHQYTPYGIPEGGTGADAQLLRLRLGDFCYLWQSPVTRDMVPWNYTDLERFDASSTNNRLFVQFALGTNFTPTTPTSVVYLWYAALEVIYCEETRLVVGGRGPLVAAGGGVDNILYGANPITLRYASDRSLLPVLNPGDWTVTLSTADQGDAQTIRAGYPQFNAARELYALPPHPGLQIDVPYPPEDHVGDPLTATVTHVLPQISVHTSGGPLTEVHAYGRQAAAPVYGAISATQDIYDDGLGTSYTYPQVRFYARKWPTTTVPLKLDSTNVTGSGMNVQITPAEHDALPEIVDGWKECTLRFSSAPSMGSVAGDPAWRFTSVGEQPGSRWEVLSACAPAISGLAGDLLANVPSPHRLGVATYQPPSGSTVDLTWKSPYVSGATADADCDAVLIFAQDPPTVTGIAVTQLTQTLTTTLNCSAGPCCIPTGISYNRVTWGLPVNTGIADDTFGRTVAAGGWGTASDGKTWTTPDLATDFSVDGSNGLIVPTVLNSNRRVWVDVGGPDQDVIVEVRISDAAESGNLRGGVLARVADGSNYYWADIRQTGTAVLLVVSKRVAGVETQLASITSGSLLPSYTTPRKIRLQVQGTRIRAKVWDSDQPEPWWQYTGTDSALTTGNNAGCYADDTTGAATTTFYFDNFTVRPPDHAFGAVELQRYDQITGTFETIMSAGSPHVTGFNDFEARAGINSVYRARTVNTYQFAGPWSTQVTGAPPTPGVTGNCTDNTGVLIFTSNADQTGARNCAYTPQWAAGNTPTDSYTLPEGNNVQYQELYTKDGRVAFHGTERGLEAFTRQLLIQNGRSTPPILAGVITARDLVWADLPYVCVRDDLGNRWYANVRIPEITVTNDRAVFEAVVNVVELTRTPAIVDPT